MPRVVNMNQLWDCGVGAFLWTNTPHLGTDFRTLLLLVPDRMYGNAKGLLVTLYIRNWKNLTPVPGPLWDWDGNEDRPTLAPSIVAHPIDVRAWHGYLQQGELISLRAPIPNSVTRR